MGFKLHVGSIFLVSVVEGGVIKETTVLGGPGFFTVEAKFYPGRVTAGEAGEGVEAIEYAAAEVRFAERRIIAKDRRS